MADIAQSPNNTLAHATTFEAEEALREWQRLRQLRVPPAERLAVIDPSDPDTAFEDVLRRVDHAMQERAA